MTTCGGRDCDTRSTRRIAAYTATTPSASCNIALGLQFPNDASVATLSFPGFGFSNRAWFLYAQWNPELTGRGSGQYSLTYYESPQTAEQSATRGWSLNAAQDLNASWALFARANSTSGTATAIRTSYALGIAMKDPLHRNPADQIGLAIGYSDPADLGTATASERAEKLIETYWNWGFSGGLLLTPDLQLILDPALDPGRDSVWVVSLRTTLSF